MLVQLLLPLPLLLLPLPLLLFVSLPPPVAGANRSEYDKTLHL